PARAHRDAGAAPRLSRADPDGPPPRRRRRLARGGARGHSTGLGGGPGRAGADHGRRLPADLLHGASPRLRLLLPARVRVPAPPGRLASLFPPPPRTAGFYLAGSLLARDLEIFRACLRQLALPAVTMALFVMAPLARMTRASMLGVLGSDFIRTARASGLA